MKTRTLPAAHDTLPPDALAPDGSEIRLLVEGRKGSMVHCRLPGGGVSGAVRDGRVEEVWYCLAGRGALWRSLGGREETVVLEKGVSADIPTGAHFQFRAEPGPALEILIVTMPPWPGPEEAERVEDHWPPSQEGP